MTLTRLLNSRVMWLWSANPQTDAISSSAVRTFAGFEYDFMYGRWADLSPEERRADLDEMWAEGSLNFWVGLFPELFFDSQVNEEISAFVRDKMRTRIKDPEVAEKLIPTSYGFGTRRVPLETNYFEAFNRDNVELAHSSRWYPRSVQMRASSASSARP